MIPREINFIWTGSPLPKWVEENIRHWVSMNSDFSFKVLDENCLCDEYREAFHIVKDLLGINRKNPPDLCTLSDLLRLSALREKGGWYVDCDFAPIKPWDDLYQDHDLSTGCFLTQQWLAGPKRIANGIIGVAKDSPVWSWLDEYVVKTIQCPDRIERTTFGPLMVTRLATEVPEVVLGAVWDFYSIRFNPKGTATKVYNRLATQSFGRSALHKEFGDRLPYCFHLWMGGDYSALESRQKVLSKKDVLTAEQPPVVVPTTEDALQNVTFVTVARKGLHQRGQIVRFANEVHDMVPGAKRYCITDMTNIEALPLDTIPLQNKKWPIGSSVFEVFRSDLPFAGNGDRVIFVDLDICVTGKLLPLLQTDYPFAMMCGIKRRNKMSTGMISWVGDYSQLYEDFKIGDLSDSSAPEFIAERTQPAIIQDILSTNAIIRVRSK